MKAQVPFKNPATGEVKTVKVGFSWVMFFFSPLFGLPFFMRGLPSLGARLMLGTVGAPIFLGTIRSFTEGVTLAVVAALTSMVLFGFIGNKVTAQHYLKKGWSFAEPNGAATAEGCKRWRLTPPDRELEA